MSISYNGVVGFGSGKVTLPSVESWSTNMNILRDPPKGITTRRIDKVGQTPEITTMIDGSGDRITDAINIYARGVNPMVGVSYNNYGNNGGQNGAPRTGGGKNAFLPYRIMREGAFRPPIKDQRDYLPISRLPRIWTSSYTQPGFADFSKKAMVDLTDLNQRSVKKPSVVLKGCIQPTATYQISQPIIENFEVRQVIKNPLHVSGSTTATTNIKLNADPGEQTSGIVYNPLRVDKNVNLSAMSKNGENNYNPQNNIHNRLQGTFNTNVSQDINVTPIDDVLGIENRIKDNINIDYTSHKNSITTVDFIPENIELDRVTPLHDAFTNANYKVEKRMDGQHVKEYVPNRPHTQAETNYGSSSYQSYDLSEHNYNLKPTINQGGFDGAVTLPTFDRAEAGISMNQEQSNMRRKIYEMQNSRSTAHSIPFTVSDIPVYN